MDPPAKYRVWGWAKSKDGRAYKVVGAFGVWAILFLSKFTILETSASSAIGAWT